MGTYTAHLVGESNYQRAVGRLRAGDPVLLIPEPGNPHDPRAIRAATGAGETIGYVERGSWLTGAIIDQRAKVAANVMEIIGGGSGRMLGVVLEVRTGREAAAPVHAPAAPEPPRPGSGRTIGIVAAIAVVLLVLSQCGEDAEAPPASAPKLSASAVASCREAIKSAEDAGLIKGRPQPTRIDVEDRKWAALPAETKDRLMQAVSCDVWQTAMPPDEGLHYVVAYGFRSGKRVQMLTSEGMGRE